MVLSGCKEGSRGAPYAESKPSSLPVGMVSNGLDRLSSSNPVVRLSPSDPGSPSSARSLLSSSSLSTALKSMTPLDCDVGGGGDVEVFVPRAE